MAKNTEKAVSKTKAATAEVKTKGAPQRRKAAEQAPKAVVEAPAAPVKKELSPAQKEKAAAKALAELGLVVGRHYEITPKFSSDRLYGELIDAETLHIWRDGRPGADTLKIVAAKVANVREINRELCYELSIVG